MSDDWVYIGSYNYHTQYYSKSSVTIDEQKNTINVLVKSVAERKDLIYLKNILSIKEIDYIQINQQLKWYALNYEKWQSTIIRITDYSKSGKALLDTKGPPEWLHKIFPVKWDDIIPDSIVDFLLNKLLHDYNIWKDYQVNIENNYYYNLPGKSSKVMTTLNLLVAFVTKNLN